MKHHKKFLAVVLPTVLFLPLIALAATPPIVPCDGVTVPCTFNKLVEMINNILRLFLILSASIMTVTFAWAGAIILLHPGNAAERTKALGMFKKTIIGMLIVLCSWLVIHTVITALVVNPGSALRFLQK